MKSLEKVLSAFFSGYEVQSRIMDRLLAGAMHRIDRKKLLGMALNEMLALCNCKSGSILLIDAVRRDLVFEVVRGPKTKALSGTHIPLSKGIVGWVAMEGKPAWVHQPDTDSRFDPTVSLCIGVPAKSIICAPIPCGTAVAGVVEIIQSRSGVDFEYQQFELLRFMCAQIGYVLLRTRELDQNYERISRLNTLTRISKAINSEKNLPRLLTLITDSATRLMKSEAGSTVLKDERSGELVFEATDKKHMQVLKMRLASGTGIIGQVINTGEKLIIEDFQKDDRAYKKVDKKTGFTTHSALCVPIKKGKSVIGALEVLNRIVPEPFSHEDLAVFEALADLSAVAIENARLYENLNEQVKTLEKRNTELQSARAQLIRSEKFAIIGEMAAGMSHEIRNLITPIRLIVDEPPDAKELDHAQIIEEYRMIKEQIDKATEMTGGMLSFSRRSDTGGQVFQINTVLQKCSDIIRYRFRNSAVKVRYILGKENPSIKGQPSQIEQVMINLINNAENAITGSGTITISTKKAGTMLCIRIRDTGCGIKKENFEKVWEPFFTTKDERTGTGLGLPICANIIHQHHGTITIASKEGRGTVVTVLLPIHT